MSNLLIVESKADKFFIERLMKELTIPNTFVASPICIDEYQCMKGLSPKDMERQFTELGTRVRKDNIEKVGILIDADEEGIKKRLSLINEAFLASSLQENLSITKMNHWYDSKELKAKIACHITNVDEYGELETILKQIISIASPHMDCLKAWRVCLGKKDTEITDKKFLKFQMSHFFRYDALDFKEQKDAAGKANLEYCMSKDIWDFKHEALDDLICFLRMFEK